MLLSGGLLLGGLLTLAAASASELHYRPVDDYAPLPRDTPRVALEVLVGGRPLPTVAYAGRAYLVVPRLGDEYEIRVRNYGPRRVTAIVSVDGLSVINGEPASEANPGYVVAPRGEIVIDGWRRNTDTVAAFRFVERERSYAARTGRPDNVGVIGLIAVEEQTPRPVPPPQPLERKEGGAFAPRKADAAVGETGTGYGRDIDSRVYYVPFVRSGNKRTIVLYYDTAEALRRAGVPVEGRFPEPFPGDGGFVPPPPGYRDR